MKILFSILLGIATLAGCAAIMITSPQSLAEDTVRDIDSKVSFYNNNLGDLDSITCVVVGPAEEDPLISNLDNASDFGYPKLQHDMEYYMGTWYMDGTVIGTAANEDEGFDACGTVDFMQPIIAERDAIVAAGGYGG